MSLMAKEKGGTTMELIPQGVHVARCVSVIDLGTQKIKFKDQEKDVHQVRFEFELPNETYTFTDKETEEEKTWTRITGRNFTVSLNGKATLRKFLESWRGRKFTQEELDGFNLGKVLGKTCQLQIIHSDDGKYANIENALPLMKGIEVPESDREQLMFSIEEDEKGNPTGFDQDVFDKLPEWQQEKLMESKEMRELFWIESLDDQEENMKKEAEAKKKETTKTATTEDAEEIFDSEPATTTKARAKAKSKAESEDTKAKEEADDPFDEE